MIQPRFRSTIAALLTVAATGCSTTPTALDGEAITVRGPERPLSREVPPIETTTTTPPTTTSTTTTTTTSPPSTTTTTTTTTTSPPSTTTTTPPTTTTTTSTTTTTTTNPRPEVAPIPADVLFAPNSAVLQPGAPELLRPVLDHLERFPDSCTKVDGHTDADGTKAFNDLLSNQRATAVGDFLVDRGEDPDRISARGYGEDDPAADNDTDAGKAANRRVEVAFVSCDALGY